MTATTAHFAETYAQARSRFLAAATERGARLESYGNPRGPGPDGEPLCTDVAWLGPAEPDRLLVCVSGTHGVEGFAGSAIQSGLLQMGFPADPPPGFGFMLVHALNPYGFAYQRRVNEDNVDVNRNFVDHRHCPGNRSYGDLHHALVPDTWDDDGQARADEFLRDYARRNGPRVLQAAITRGQWAHPDGLFYGGSGPVWSHRTLRAIAGRYLRRIPKIGYIDLHTGLGRRGWGEPIFRGGRDPQALDRARAWYGEYLTISEDGSSSSTPITGNTASLVADVLEPDARLTAITLEFGTLSGQEVLASLRADNWLYLHQDAPPWQAKKIKQAILDAFYPSDQAWRDAIWERAVTVFGQAYRGLCEDGRP